MCEVAKEIIDINRRTFKEYELIHYLLPVEFWKEFPDKLLDIVNDANKWNSFQVLKSDGSVNDEGFSKVSNSCGGVYSFVIIPPVFLHNQKTLLYIGVATLKKSENLRQRISSYKKHINGKDPYIKERAFLGEQFFKWREYLYCVYHEMPNNENSDIEELEKQLIWAMEPPCNPDQEGNNARAIGRRSAFGG